MIETADEFRRLRESGDPDEQRRATHDEAPAAVWQAVIASAPDLRVWVAPNKTVPSAILELLAADPDPRVRSMVAMKRALAPALQVRLAADPDEAVRHHLARNARATRAALERLASDAWPVVAETARARLAAGEYV